MFVLSQLDDRYFRGLEGQYTFLISFQLFRSDQPDYIMSSSGEDKSNRSVSVELDLEAGMYEVRLKVSAVRDKEADKIEDVVKSNWLERREKLLGIGLSYHFAHAKAQNEEAVERQVEASQYGSQVSQAVPGKDNDRSYEEKTEDKKDANEKDSRGGFNDRTNPQKVNSSKREPSEEPWNATCVVGLRVYTQNSDATIKVVGSKEEKVIAPKRDNEPLENNAFSIRSVT